jgi:hypothetical protein
MPTKLLKSSFYGNNIEHQNKKHNLKLASNKEPRCRTLKTMGSREVRTNVSLPQQEMRKKLTIGGGKGEGMEVGRKNKYRSLVNNHVQQQRKCCIKLEPIRFWERGAWVSNRS